MYTKMILFQLDKYYIEQMQRIVCGGQQKLYDLLISINIFTRINFVCVCVLDALKIKSRVIMDCPICVLGIKPGSLTRA